MSQVQKTVTLEQLSLPGSEKRYRVIRTRNTLDPEIKAVLTKREVERLIDEGTEVVVNDRK